MGDARISHLYTGGMGIPTLKSEDSLVHRIDLSSYWSLPFVLNEGDSTTVFVRAVYDSARADPKRSFLPKNADEVWVGKVATDWQKVRLSNVSGKGVNTKFKGKNILE